MDPGSWIEKFGSATLLAIFVKFDPLFCPENSERNVLNI
jgi:hypothetical protein